MGFSRQEYWSGLPFPPPGDLSDPGIEPASLESPALAGGSVPLAPPRKPKYPQGLKPNSELVGCEYFFSQQHRYVALFCVIPFRIILLSVNISKLSFFW